ncbi:MAG TPA: hypothetical protein VMD52_04225 [Patescibacteria group bacterium]|nr:hypothetical protein [Patescibacteria group bacterium]
MKKIVLLLCALSGIALLLAGCQTAKGTAEGAANTTSATVEGLSEDTSSFWYSIKKADEWIRENLW